MGSIFGKLRQTFLNLRQICLNYIRMANIVLVYCKLVVCATGVLLFECCSEWFCSEWSFCNVLVAIRLFAIQFLFQHNKVCTL